MVVGALALSLTAALSPTAASAEVVVSPDGTLYTHEISGLLDGGVLVPLDTATDSFSVRSDAATPGYLRVLLSDVTSTDPALRGALTVAVATPGSTGEAVPLSAADPCAQLLTPVPLAPGQSVTVDTELAMGDLTGLTGQDARFSFRLQVVLSDDAQQSDSCADGAGGGSGGSLGGTGGTVPVLAASAAAAAIAAGLSLLLGARRRRSGA